MTKAFLIISLVLLNSIACVIALFISRDTLLYPYADSDSSSLAKTISRDALDSFRVLSYLGILCAGIALIIAIAELRRIGLWSGQKSIFIGGVITAGSVVLYFVYRLLYLAQL